MLKVRLVSLWQSARKEAAVAEEPAKKLKKHLLTKANEALLKLGREIWKLCCRRVSGSTKQLVLKVEHAELLHKAEALHKRRRKVLGSTANFSHRVDLGRTGSSCLSGRGWLMEKQLILAASVRQGDRVDGIVPIMQCCAWLWSVGQQGPSAFVFLCVFD